MTNINYVQFSTKDRLYYSRLRSYTSAGTAKYQIQIGFIDRITQTDNVLYSENISNNGSFSNQYPTIFMVTKEGDNEILFYNYQGSLGTFTLKYDITNKVKLSTPSNIGLAIYMYQQQVYDNKAFVKYRNLNIPEKWEFFLYDILSFVRSDVMVLQDQSTTEHCNYSYYYEGKIWVMTDTGSGTDRHWELRRYDPTNGTFTTLYQTERIMSNSYFGVSFLANGIIYFLTGYQEYLISAGSYSYYPTFEVRAFDIYSLTMLVNQTCGISLPPNIWHKEERGCLVNGDNSDYAFFGTARYEPLLQSNAPQFSRLELPMRTIPSIKGATYNLNKTAWVNGVKQPANRDFILQDNYIVKLSVLDETVSGTIKIPSQAIG